MLLTVLGVVIFTVGLAIGWYGVRPLAGLPRMVRREPLTPSEARTADSFVVCRGVAADDGETVAGPFTGTRCLGFEFEVTERQPFGVGLPWFHAHLDDGVATVPFRLRDGRGDVRVDPAPGRFSLDTESTVVTVGPSETPSERIRRFVDVRQDLSPVAGWVKAIPGFGTRRYVERRVDPGEEYVVAGQLTHQQGETTLAGDLVIGDPGPRRIVLNRLRTAVFPLFVATIFAGVGVLMVLL